MWNRHLSKFVIAAFIRFSLLIPYLHICIAFLLEMVAAAAVSASREKERISTNSRIHCMLALLLCCCCWYDWCRELNPQFCRLFFYSLTVGKVLLNGAHTGVCVCRWASVCKCALSLLKHTHTVYFIHEFKVVKTHKFLRRIFFSSFFDFFFLSLVCICCLFLLLMPPIPFHSSL